MDAGHLGGCDDVFRICLGVEACDVLLHGTRKQFERLRQIADMGPQLFRGPLGQRGAVQPHIADIRRPGAHQNPRQRSLAGRTRPDDTQPVTCGQIEADILKNRRPIAAVLLPGSEFRHSADGELALGRGQLHDLRCADFREKFLQAFVGLPGAHDHTPLSDDLIHRRQGPARNDRRRNDHSGRDFLLQRQITAQPEERGLQEQAECL